MNLIKCTRWSMQYIKLFESIKMTNVDEVYDPYGRIGRPLNSKEISLLEKTIGNGCLRYHHISYDDGYYYIEYSEPFSQYLSKNIFMKADGFQDLKDCIQFFYYYNYRISPSKLLETLKRIISNDGDLNIYNNLPIIVSAQKGWVDMVEYLITRPEVDPSAQNNLAFSSSTKLEIRKVLLKDPRVCNTLNCHFRLTYLKMSARWGWLDIFENLISEENVEYSKRVDPSSDFNYCIRWAFRNNHREIVKILLKDKRVRDKLKSEELIRYQEYLNGY